MTPQDSREPVPTVILDTVTWRRLAANPAYLAKIKQLRRLQSAGALHLSVPEIVAVEFERRIPDLEANWARSVDGLVECPAKLRAHFPEHEAHLLEIANQLRPYGERLKQMRSQNLAEVNEIIANSRCCRLSDSSLAESSRRAIYKVAPSHGKPSTGDCLVWLCVLAHLKKQPVMFCSENTADFADGNDELYPDLHQEASLCDYPITYETNVDRIIERFAELSEPEIPYVPARAYSDSLEGPDRDRPQKCPKCGREGTFSAGFWGRSYGGLSWTYRCNYCGLMFDTGDDYD